MLKSTRAVTLIEMTVVLAIGMILASIIAPVGLRLYENTSLAISANNIRQLSIGAQSYLADNRFVYWKYVGWTPKGTVWWFGLEPPESRAAGEGKRFFKPNEGPLAGYIPAALRPDPSFSFTGKTFKPKFQSGYLGVGYNVHLGGGWMGADCKNFWELKNPSKTVVFATSAQVNTFQRPASRSNPMIEEFYGIDSQNLTVHFRHRGKAMVGFADGSSGFLPLDPSTLDPRAPEAKVGRFAPVGSLKYLQ
ncbi:MAG: type II secretion system protein [Chthoniobacterales bacterium]